MTSRALAVPLALSAAALSAAVALRTALVDGQALRRARADLAVGDLLLSPGPAALAAASLEHPLAWADLFWLDIVQEFGRPLDGEKPAFARIARWADIATDLDPRYFAVYHATAIQLTVYARDAVASDRLLEKGYRALEDAWPLPFLLGYNAFFLHGDPEAAARWWFEAARLPDAPRFVPSLAARARVQAGDDLGAESMLLELIETGALEGPQLEDAQIRLKILRSEPALRAYDEACARVRAAEGRVPAAEELFRRGLVTAPPFDLLEKPIVLDDGCRARTEYIRLREDELAERLGAAARDQARAMTTTATVTATETEEERR